MAIAFENVSTGYVAGYPAHVTPISLFNIDAGTNADRCVVLWVFAKSGLANSGYTATCGGNAMTTYTEQSFGGVNDKVMIFTYVGAASGSNAITLQFTGDANLRAVAGAWSGVGGVANAAYVADTTGDTTATLTITSATGDLAVVGFGLNATAGERFTAAGTEVKHYDADLGTESISIFEKAGAASVTITANSDGTTVYEYAYGISLTAAAGGGSANGAAAYYYSQL